LASALAPNASSAPLIMILLIVPLIVLSGALAPVPSSVSAVASTRWAFQSLLGITGMGSDVGADPCWKLPEVVRDEMSLDDKEAAGCTCMGVIVFDPQSCNFPGNGQFYTAEIDQPPPTEPPPLGEKPAEPVLPPTPEPPADTTSTVDLIQYFNSLQSYMDDVEFIQTDYKNQMSLYESEANVYQEEMISYQEAKTEWEIARNSAVQSAEGTIEGTRQEFGWAWVNKHDQDSYRIWLLKTWLAQLGIILAYFLIILVLIKRKDAK